MSEKICDYCHNVGTCPKCWGRGQIDELRAENKALRRELYGVPPPASIDRPRNIVLCKGCLDVLESKHCHDFVQCKCPNKTFTDGGTDYMRIGGVDMELVEVIENPRKKD